MIRFQCSYCYRAHETPPEARGRTGRCVCGRRLRVPDPEDGGNVSSGPGGLILAAPAEEAQDETSLDLRRLSRVAADRLQAPPPADPKSSSSRPRPASTVALPPPAPTLEPQGVSQGLAAPMDGRRRGRRGGYLCLAASGGLFAALSARLLGEGLPGGWIPRWLLAPGSFATTALLVLSVGLLLEGFGRLRPISGGAPLPPRGPTDERGTDAQGPGSGA